MRGLSHRKKERARADTCASSTLSSIRVAGYCTVKPPGAPSGKEIQPILPRLLSLVPPSAEQASGSRLPTIRNSRSKVGVASSKGRRFFHAARPQPPSVLYRRVLIRREALPLVLNSPRKSLKKQERAGGDAPSLRHNLGQSNFLASGARSCVACPFLTSRP